MLLSMAAAAARQEERPPAADRRKRLVGAGRPRKQETAQLRKRPIARRPGLTCAMVLGLGRRWRGLLFIRGRRWRRDRRDRRLLVVVAGRRLRGRLRRLGLGPGAGRRHGALQ
ncbi:hypothetical protein MTO96_006820 [Rhipicephalus appendiculatus]